MNVVVIHAHSANRGDEAAVKAMCDEILALKPDTKIDIFINGNTSYPNMDNRINQYIGIPVHKKKVSYIEFFITYLSSGKLVFSKEIARFVDALENADLVVHAPGGPSIGDIYSKAELFYLLRLDLAYKMKKPYMFYAPSMGPFLSRKHLSLRKKVLNNARAIVLRDPISLGYLQNFLPNIKAELALDSAIQHDLKPNISEIYYSYDDLKKFIDEHPKCVGITITELQWHPKYKNTDISETIKKTFTEVIDELHKKGYGIVFIPQLYGSGNDTSTMLEYMRNEDTFMVDSKSDIHDAYFQQYLIGNIFAVIGMRYHSNIFSAKMGTPFVSVAYEQKMSGFMRKMELNDYCISIDDLSAEAVLKKFSLLENNYDEYKCKLLNMHDQMKKESRKTTDILLKLLEE